MNYLLSLQKILNHPTNKNSKTSVLGRLLLWKFNQLFLHKPITVRLTPEIKCVCHPDSSFGSLVIYTKFPEYEEMRFVQDYLNNDDIFIDVGANIGAFSLLAASKIKSGKIYAFEPSSKVYDQLGENIRVNDLEKRIFAIKMVVSEDNGIVKFVTGRHSEVDHIAYNSTYEEVNGIKSTTLDSFAKKKKIKNVDLVKIDVEGAELKVLQGFREYLSKRKVGVLLFEINKNSERFGNGAIDTISFIRNLGYKIYELDSQNKLIEFKEDGLKGRATFNILAVSGSKEVQKRLERFC